MSDFSTICNSLSLLLKGQYLLANVRSHNSPSLVVQHLVFGFNTICKSLSLLLKKIIPVKNGLELLRSERLFECDMEETFEYDMEEKLRKSTPEG